MPLVVENFAQVTPVRIEKLNFLIFSFRHALVLIADPRVRVDERKLANTAKPQPIPLLHEEHFTITGFTQRTRQAFDR
jgi:hypothetical protein